MLNGLRTTALMVTFFVLALALMLRAGHHEDTRNLRQRVSDEGGIRAYGNFKDELANQRATRSESHARMHEFGAALYDSEGIGGIGVCDAAYDFGCYHGFFSRAVSDAGDSIVPKLADACRKKFGSNSTGCEHGIGHGIMEYVGPAGLLRGLALCEGTHQANPLYGCTSGLFMEFSMPMTYKNGTVETTIRPFDSLHPRAPCDSIVPTQYRLSCYFEISAWWGHVFSDDSKAGNECSLAATDAENLACWKGWGAVIAEKAQYDARKTIPLCNLIHDPRGRDECMLGVAMRLFAMSGQEDDATRICATLTGDMKVECSTLQSH